MPGLSGARIDTCTPLHSMWWEMTGVWWRYIDTGAEEEDWSHLVI